jgi:hypothetical protein
MVGGRVAIGARQRLRRHDPGRAIWAYADVAAYRMDAAGYNLGENTTDSRNWSGMSDCKQTMEMFCF